MNTGSEKIRLFGDDYIARAKLKAWFDGLNPEQKIEENEWLASVLLESIELEKKTDV